MEQWNKAEARIDMIATQIAKLRKTGNMENNKPTTEDRITMEERISKIADIMVLQSRVIKQQTLILSEHYKKCDISSNGKQLTDDEKLKRSFNIIDRHINQMQDIKDNLCD